MLNKVTSINFNKDMFLPFHITYINNFSYMKVRLMDLKGYTHIGVDGFLFQKIYNLFSRRKKINRTSFDFTSNAPEFLRYIKENDLRACFIGGKESEISKFENLMDSSEHKHTKLGYYSGYPLDQGFESWEAYFDHIDISKYDVVVLGLGAPLQEQIGMLIMNIYKDVSTVTCGGFISQCSINDGFNYYPSLINKLNMRWLYRIFRESHVLKRVIFDYPISVLIIIYDCLNLDSLK